jgi:Ran GTPase-activating protein (RanGAP) involved in mRNA processing and transport
MRDILVQSLKESLEPDRLAVQTTHGQSLVPGVFARALEAVPSEDWSTTWAGNRTIMLRMTSKKIKNIIDKMHLPVFVHLKMSFWQDIRNGTINEKIQLVTRQLSVLACTYKITSLELPRSKMNIKEILDQCKSLTNLNLYDNNLGTTGVISLVGVLGQFSVLNLDNNNINTEGANHLVGVLTQCTNLNLSNNNIGTAGLENIEKCKTLTMLTYLNLCYNQINTVNIDKILSQNTGLTHLDLSQNQINKLSFDRIQIQTKYFALTDFNLSYNHIGVDGAVSLASVLKQCTALSSLNLAYDYIGTSSLVKAGSRVSEGDCTDGATSLAGALGQCTALTKLYLVSNFIGNDGIDRLIEVLSQSTVLTYITIRGNGIDEDRANNLAEVLGHRVKLM